MGRTFAKATLAGADKDREYEFMVDTGSTYVGLPQSEIDELGLQEIPNGVEATLTANGVVERQTYWAIGYIDGRGFGCIVSEAPTPLIGYHLLQTMIYIVNPVTETLERAPDEEIGPPYILLRRKGHA